MGLAHSHASLTHIWAARNPAGCFKVPPKRLLQPKRYTKIFLPHISGRTAPSMAREIYSFVFLILWNNLRSPTEVELLLKTHHPHYNYSFPTYIIRLP